MEFPRLGVQSELQLLAYATATATQDPSCVCDLHLSSRQCQILNPFFAILITMCLGVSLFGSIIYGTLHFLALDEYFLSQIREVFNYYIFKYVLSPFLFPSGTLMMWILACLMLFQRFLKMSSFLFIFFFYSTLPIQFFVFQLPDPFSSVLSNLLWICSGSFFSYYILHLHLVVPYFFS